METTLIVLSVISTLAVVLLLWTAVSLRSAQKTLKEHEDRFNDFDYKITTEHEHVHHRIDDVTRELEHKMVDDLDHIHQEISRIHEDMDKRFDKCYRTQYEFRDWSKEQIERLIEKDLDKNK
jgi:flagellar motility protein MotE (MotC chaperone)